MYEKGFPGCLLFERESYFYYQASNLFRNITDNASIDFSPFIPKAYNTMEVASLDQNQNLEEEPLILENLCAKGFEFCTNSMSCFDLPHAELTLDLYGKFHAMGMMFHETKVDNDEIANKLFRLNIISIFMENEVHTHNFEEGMRMFINWMEGKADYNDSCERLKSLLNNQRYQEIALDLFKQGAEHEMQVIQHGNARWSNILFKYDENKTSPSEVKIVDFQQLCYFVPFYDIGYFLALDLPASILIENFRQLVGR